jgi:hypothetical protein
MTQSPQLSIMKHLHGWHVASASRPDTRHFVTNVPHWRCTCSAMIFGHGAPCRHIRAVRASLAREKEVVYRN